MIIIEKIKLRISWIIGVLLGVFFFGIYPANYAYSTSETSIEFWKVYRTSFLKLLPYALIAIVVGIILYFDMLFVTKYSDIAIVRIVLRPFLVCASILMTLLAMLFPFNYFKEFRFKDQIKVQFMIIFSSSKIILELLIVYIISILAISFVGWIILLFPILYIWFRSKYFRKNAETIKFDKVHYE